MRALSGIVFCVLGFVVAQTARADHWSNLRQACDSYHEVVVELQEEVEHHVPSPYVVQSVGRLRRAACQLNDRVQAGPCSVGDLQYAWREVSLYHQRTMQLLSETCHINRHVARAVSRVQDWYGDVDETIECISHTSQRPTYPQRPQTGGYPYHPGFPNQPGFPQQGGWGGGYGQGWNPGFPQASQPGSPWNQGSGNVNPYRPSMPVPGQVPNVGQRPASPFELGLQIQQQVFRSIHERSRR